MTPSSMIARPQVVSRSAADDACDVCPHGLDSHDAIGRRFCQATLDRALPRGCACRSASVPA